MDVSTSSIETTTSVLSSVISFMEDISDYLLEDADGRFTKCKQDVGQFHSQQQVACDQRDDSNLLKTTGKYKAALEKYRGYPKIFIISPRTDYAEASESRDDSSRTHPRVEVTNEDGKFKSSLHKALYKIRLQQFSQKDEPVVDPTVNRRYKVGREGSCIRKNGMADPGKRNQKLVVFSTVDDPSDIAYELHGLGYGLYVSGKACDPDVVARKVRTLGYDVIESRGMKHHRKSKKGQDEARQAPTDGQGRDLPATVTRDGLNEYLGLATCASF